jgi:hypothetical protein
MAKCAYCGSLILFGGVREKDLRFCNAKCHQKGYALRISKEIPQDVVDKNVGEIHRGLCPKCQGSGPVDVHTSYRVYSLLLYTSWSSRPHICCRSCGMKSQIGDAVYSFLFGWWGFPWGFLVTPVQVVRNIVDAINAPDETRPSEKLRNIVRLSIASSVLAQQQKNVT